MAHESFCPYVGLQPYTEDDRQFFFGREREQRIISSNLYASSLTVVYGASGVGKSSILRAGVVPYLQSAENTTVVYFNQWQDPSFVDALKADCLKAVKKNTREPLLVDINKPLHKFLASLERQSGSALLILLDQFEEYFLYHPEDNGAANFDAEFASAVNQNRAELGFMIALRDDWLSRLDRFQRRIPNLLGNTYRLEHLTSAAAEESVRKPLQVYNQKFSSGTPFLIEDELVREVLAQVRAGELNLCDSQGSGQAKGAENQDRIETAFLQLVMTRLWREEMKCGSSRLRATTLRQLGGARQIVQSHLDNVLGTLARPQQDMCASMFRYLVTPRGSKVAHETADLVAFAEHPAEQVRPLLEKLADPSTHLLRRLAQPERYEIFHDVLGPAVLDWRARYNKDQEKAELAKQAEAEAQRKNANRFRQLAMALAILFLVAVATAGYAWHLSDRANELALEENKSARLAKQKAQDATDSATEAKAKTGEAVTASARAANSEAQAVQQTRIAHAHQLAAEALVNLTNGGNRETSILLALDALRITYEHDGKTLPDVEEALRRTIQVPAMELVRPGHSKPVTNMAFSPDGKLLVTSGMDDTVRMWDGTSQQELAVDSQVQCNVAPGVVFSRNGTTFACANAKELRVWDAQHHQQILRLSLAPGSPNALPDVTIQQIAHSPDGRSVIAGCSDRKIRRWDVSSGKLVETFAGRSPYIIESGRRLAYLTSDGIHLRDFTTGQEQNIALASPTLLAVSADGSHLAAKTASEQPITIWDARSLTQATASFTDQTAKYLAISRDGSRAATYDSVSQVKLWNLTHPATPPILINFPGVFRSSSSASLYFSPDGSTLILQTATGGKNPENKAQSLRFWNTASGTSTIGESWIAAAFSEDATHVALAAASSLRIEDTKARRSVHVLYDRDQSFNMAAFSPDGRYVAIAGLDYQINVWDRSTGAYLGWLGEHSADVQDMQFSPNGQFLVTASNDGTAKVWDIAARAERFPSLIPEPAGSNGVPTAVFCAVFSLDSKLIATASVKSAQIWDVGSGRHVASVTPNSPGTRVEDLAFSPDGRQLAIIAGKTEFWDISSSGPRFLGDQPKPADMSYSVAFTPDGNYLVAPGTKGMKLWDSAHKWRDLPEGLVPCTDASDCVEWLGVAIGPDKKSVAGPGKSGTIVVWDLRSGKEMRTLFAGKAILKALAYSPEGNSLYTLAEDWRIYAHPVGVQDLMNEARKQIDAVHGTLKELDDPSCRELLHESCPAEVQALRMKVPQGKQTNSR